MTPQGAATKQYAEKIDTELLQVRSRLEHLEEHAKKTMAKIELDGR